MSNPVSRLQGFRSGQRWEIRCHYGRAEFEMTSAPTKACDPLLPSNWYIMAKRIVGGQLSLERRLWEFEILDPRRIN